MYTSFDKVYGQPEEPFYYGLQGTEKLEDYIKKEVNLNKGAVALDLGSGEGRNTLLLTRYGFNVHAVDMSVNGLQKLERYAKLNSISGIKCVEADIRQYQLKPHSYDAVVAVTLLDHLELEDGRKVAEMIQSSLKPGGFVFVEVFTQKDPGARFAVEDRFGVGISDTASFIKHYFDEGELAEWFSELELVHYEEKMKYDDHHNTPHYHGLALLIGVRKNIRSESHGDEEIADELSDSSSVAH